jgi:hypothetical protein
LVTAVDQLHLYDLIFGYIVISIIYCREKEVQSN